MRTINKYRNIKTTYKGKKFDSGLEAKTCLELDMMQKSGKIQSYQTQVKIPILIKGQKFSCHPISNSWDDDMMFLGLTDYIPISWSGYCKYEKRYILFRNVFCHDPGFYECEFIGNYIVDFVVTMPTSTKRFIDAKGFKTPVYKLKKRLVESIYGIVIEESL